MTRKDYKAIAEILSEHRKSIDAMTFSRIAADFRKMFQQDNPAFHPEKFDNAAYGRK